MTQTHKKKLIEVAMPLEAINKACAYEKMPGIGPHPRGLHQYWARRPLCAARAILFAQLVDDPSSDPEKFKTESEVKNERARLFKIIEKLVKWENSNNNAVLDEAINEIILSCGENKITIYDPFSGGGAIPLEAQRLGLKSRGSDLNPLAVMIGKAIIEIPRDFYDQGPMHPGERCKLNYSGMDGLAEDVEHYGEIVHKLVSSKIGKIYPKVSVNSLHGEFKANVVAWLWTRSVKCQNPGCGKEMPLLSTFILSKKKGREAYLIPDTRTEKISFKVKSEFDYNGLKASNGFKRGVSATFECAYCKNITDRDYVSNEGKNGRIGKLPTAIVCNTKGGRVYVAADGSHYAPTPISYSYDFLDIKFSPNPRDIWCRNFGALSPKDLFTERQLVCLTALAEAIVEVRDHIENDLRENSIKQKVATQYAKAVSLYLAFALNRCADFSNTSARWNPGNEKIMNLFARQAIPMTWDFGEANLLSDVVGGFSPAIKYIAKCIMTLFPNGEGYVHLHDAQTVQYPKNTVISTDPPYYDNIGYADLSDFFYVWMKKTLKDISPEVFKTLSTPKSDELISAPYRHENKMDAEEFFLNGMRQTFKNFNQQSSADIPATIYYAFKQTEIKADGISSTGWATFLQAVIEAGYSIVGTWPIRSEQSHRMISAGTNALANSIVLVCRQKNKHQETITRSEFIRALKLELPHAITNLQSANLSPADMPQSAIGPGMAIFTKYSKVMETDDSSMSVKSALQLINAELDEFLNDLHGDFDPDTRFAATWFEQNGYEKGDFGAANSLATARGISVDSVKHAGIVESSAGKVRILKREELDPNWEPNSDSHLTIWECCQYLVREYEDGGETAAAMLIKKMGFEKADAVKDLAYYLYDICSNKRQDAKEATSYNALIAGWNDIMRMANSINDTDTIRQASLF